MQPIISEVRCFSKTYQWLKNRRLKDLCRISPDKILILIDEYVSKVKPIKTRLNNGAISEETAFIYRTRLFNNYYHETENLNYKRLINKETRTKAVNALRDLY